MNKLIIAIVVLAVVGVGTYYLVFSRGSNGTPTYTYTPTTTNSLNTNTLNTNTPKPTAQSSATPKTPVVSSVTVSIKNFSFDPSSVTIKKGTKVTWVNNDSASHTITSDLGDLLNSPNLAPGQSFSFTFTSVGATDYHCSIHPMMKGSIVITN